MHEDITDVPGILVGHDTLAEARTGCTVILIDQHYQAVGGVDVRGGAPATHETDLLDPTCTVSEVHAIVLTGGSAFGLASVVGVMSALEALGRGYDTGIVRVPIVPAAALFDLAVGRSDIRPDATSGARAVASASSGPIEQGRVGAGTGATIAKLQGMTSAKASGLGSASTVLPNGIIVGALVAVNALGDLIPPNSGAFGATSANLLTGTPTGSNTTLAVVATNAALTKAQTTKLAQMAQAGLVRAISPIHTGFDGDVVFSLAVTPVDNPPVATDIQVLSMLGAVAADTVQKAIYNAVAAVKDFEV